MLQTTLGIDGMMCGMCEAHVNDLIRKLYPGIQSVSSSCTKNQTVILSESELDQQQLKDEIAKMGYTLTSFASEPYVKKSFFQRLFGKS